MQDIKKPEELELVDTVVLNGIVGYCKTYDDNYESIGVKEIKKIVTFNGETIVTENDGFPLSKRMQDRLSWTTSYASVRMVTGKTPIDPTKVEETIIESYFGDAKGHYYHRYSDYTGYLWTEEDFKVGGHSLPDILHYHMGEYIHMEIELYRLKPQPLPKNTRKRK